MNRDDLRSILTAVLVVIVLLVLLPALIMPLMMLGGGMMFGGMMGGWNWGGNTWWGWLVMLLFWVLLIGGIALVAVWAFRRSGLADGGTAGPGRSDRGTDQALEILKQRYARGEIDREQYEQIRRDLTSAE